MFSATVSVVIFKALLMYGRVKLFDASADYFYNGVAPVGLNHEIPFFIMLALLSGLIGSFYIFVHREYLRLKLRNSSLWVFNPWIYSGLVALLITTI